MACAITIDHAITVTEVDGNGKPTKIKVTGTLTGACKTVEVQIQLGSAFTAWQPASGVATWSKEVSNFDSNGDIVAKCHASGITVNARCHDDLSCQSSWTTTTRLDCPSIHCPSQITLEVRDQNHALVDTTQGCIPAGTYQITVTQPPAAGATWSVDGLSQPMQSNSFSQTLAAGESHTIIATVSIDNADVQPCVPSRSVTLTACMATTPCPSDITLQVRDQNHVLVDTTQPCIPAGTYQIAVTQPPASASVHYSWSVDNHRQSNQINSSFSYSLAAGESHTITASVSIDNTDVQPCVVSGNVTLTACMATTPCPSDITLEVRDQNHALVDTTQGCIPAGNYQIAVTQPPASASVHFSWSVDGQRQTNQSSSFSYTLAAGGSHNINVSVSVDNTTDPHCSIPGGVTLTACAPPPPCTPVPSNYALKVLDDNGNEIPDGQCVPGSRAEVVAPDFEGGVAWQLDGQPASADPALPRRLRVPLNDDRDRTVTATVGRDSCAKSVQRTFRRCPQGQPPPSTTSSFDLCTLLRFVILLATGFACIALILWLCPGFSYAVIPPQYTWIPALAFVVLAAIALLALFLWMIICKPSLCSWAALFWEVLFIIGAVTVYAGFCPGCPWFLFGSIFLGISFVIFLWWLFKCNPTICSVFSELLFVGIAWDITAVMEMVIGFCVIRSNTFYAIGWALAVAAYNTFVLYGLNRYKCLKP